jgi:hypothetical protein
LIKGLEQIRMMPISLFVLALLITVGPWGIKWVSKKSKKHLSHIFNQKPNKKHIEEANNIIDYLISFYWCK